MLRAEVRQALLRRALSSPNRLPVICALGIAQTVAWASSYYLPAILADAMAASLGVTPTFVFAAFSASLVTAALLGPKIGRTIDRFGGRMVLAISNVTMAVGLVVLAFSNSPAVMVLAWLVLGIGMALGLYDAAFAALGRLYGLEARSPITGITLFAGFASTVGWPLSAWGLSEFGWRETCFVWALAHVAIGLPLNLSLPEAARSERLPRSPIVRIPMDKGMWLLAAAFALAWSVTGAMAAHLPRILEGAGVPTAQAVFAGMFIGPAQVVARVVEFTLMKQSHPLMSARLATLTHPIGAMLIWLGSGGIAASGFAALHGFGNGILTIARGTVPLAICGPVNYGYRIGLIGAPARIAQAVSPLAFGLIVDSIGANALLVSSALSLGALTCLAFLRAK